MSKELKIIKRAGYDFSNEDETFLTTFVPEVQGYKFIPEKTTDEDLVFERTSSYTVLTKDQRESIRVELEKLLNKLIKVSPDTAASTFLQVQRSVGENEWTFKHKLEFIKDAMDIIAAVCDKV